MFSYFSTCILKLIKAMPIKWELNACGFNIPSSSKSTKTFKPYSLQCFTDIIKLLSIRYIGHSWLASVLAFCQITLLCWTLRHCCCHSTKLIFVWLCATVIKAANNATLSYFTPLLATLFIYWCHFSLLLSIENFKYIFCLISKKHFNSIKRKIFFGKNSCD